MRSLGALGYGAVLSPLVLSLMALYITGLLLLDWRQNGTRIPDWLPARAHDAINRLLRTLSISTRALMKAIRQWAKHLGSGYLAIDDVVVAKPFCWLNPWIGWTYCISERREVRGFHIVVLLWCTGSWRIPVAFHLWRPKKKCHPKRYRKKAELAWEMVIEVLSDDLEIEYVVGDTFYTASWLTQKINRLGLKWVGVLHHKAIVYYQERRWSVASLGEWLTLKWRARLGLRARSTMAYLPRYGTLRLVVTRNRHGNVEVLTTDELDSDLTTIVLRKRSRWSIEKGQADHNGTKSSRFVRSSAPNSRPPGRGVCDLVLPIGHDADPRG